MGFKVTVEEEEDLTLPEDSIHKAILMEVSPREINWVDRRTGEAKSKVLLEFWFEVTGSSEDKYIGRKVKGSVDSKMTTRANDRFRNWSETLLGREISAGTDFDTDDIIGLSAEIVIGHRPSKDGGRVFEEVTDLLPLDASAYSEPPF